MSPHTEGPRSRLLPAAAGLFAIAGPIAERVRKFGSTKPSVGPGLFEAA